MAKKQFLKRIIILCAILVIPLFTTGCDWFGGNDDVVFEDQVQHKRIGELKSLGGVSIGQGTHLLEMKNGSTIRLRSLNINLDNEKYLNNTVEVRGLITKTEDGKELMEVKSIDLSEDEDEDALRGEPKEYNNTDLGFKLTYYDSWQITEESEKVTFTAPVVKEDDEDNEEEVAADEEEVMEDEVETEVIQDIVEILVLDNPANESIASFLSLPEDTAELSDQGYKTSNIGADNLEGIEKTSEDGTEVKVWLTRNDLIFSITYNGSTSTQSMKNKTTFYTMLNTFRFIALEDEEEEEDEEEVEIAEEEEEEIVETVEDEPELEEIDDTVNDIPAEEPVLQPNDDEEEISVTSSSTHDIVKSHIKSSINEIAPQASESGSWTATSFEFVDPDYVYVNYNDGSDSRRVLISYSDEGSYIDTEVVGYFEPGESTSWERVSGENPVQYSEKTVYDGDVEGAVVKEGFRYFESLPYDFTAQYPGNWYYSGNSGSGDTQHHYGFSNEPVENDNELVSIDIVSGSLPAGSAVSVGSKQGIKVTSNGETAIYIQREDGLLYKVHGDSGYESYVLDIASTISEN